MEDVVEHLCKKSADLNSITPACLDPPLWQALDDGQENIASVLVKLVFIEIFIYVKSNHFTAFF